MNILYTYKQRNRCFVEGEDTAIPENSVYLQKNNSTNKSYILWH